MFTTYEFIMATLASVILYYLLPKKSQPYFLLVVSYGIYFSINCFYPIYLMVTTVTVYMAALWIERVNQKGDAYIAANKESLGRDGRKAYKQKIKTRAKSILLVCIILNIGILAVTKYANFFIQNVNGWLHFFGNEKEFSFVELLVPLGISFYTFQSVGYLLDVYWKRDAAQKNLAKFALFVSFFPQIGQGPISRYKDLKKTLYEPHHFDWRVVRFGLERVLWGYFKKLVIADRIAVAVQMIMGDPEYYTGIYVFVGMMFYAVELYADFTGGIDITIGIAQMFGVRITENFIRPFFSKSIAEYWRRWHITMGTWFRDYIFYPLSISSFFRKMTTFTKKHFGMTVAKRCSVYTATIIVWITTGIWHGANWRYVAWGLCNGIVILISEELTPLYDKFHKKFPNLKGKVYYRTFQVIRTFLLMSCLRIFDRYGSCRQSVSAFVHMFTDWDFSQLKWQEFIDMGLSGTDYKILLIGVLILFLVSLFGRKESVREQIAKKPYIVRYTVFAGLFFATLLLGMYGVGYDSSAFIYNQF